MKKVAFLLALALPLMVGGCGSNTIANPINNTQTNSNWEAQLIGGTGQASLLDFVTTFSLYNTGSLSITGFGFINSGKCFATGIRGTTQSGDATLVTNSTGQVTGTFNFKVVSVTPPGNTLTLGGNLTGTSNATTTTTGTLSNGVVVGTWSLTGGAGDASCSGSGQFIMCQGANTCAAP